MKSNQKASSGGTRKAGPRYPEVNGTPGCAENSAMTVGKAFASIFVSSLILALTLGAAGPLRAQTSPQEAAEFVRTLGNEAGGAQNRRKSRVRERLR